MAFEAWPGASHSTCKVLIKPDKDQPTGILMIRIIINAVIHWWQGEIGFPWGYPVEGINRCWKASGGRVNPTAR